MSLDIEMKSFSGEENGSAAVNPFIEPNQLSQQEAAFALDLDYKPQQVSPQSTGQELNFKALRDEISSIKAEREKEKREYQQQLDMLKANSAPPTEAPKPKEMFDGMEDDYIPSVKEIKKEWSQREQLYQSRIEELTVAQQYPDYAEVLQKYVSPLTRDKPHLVQGALRAENKAMALYELGKMAQGFEQARSVPTQQVHPDAQRIVDNASKVGTLSQAGGTSVLSKADYIATMSDTDFMKFAAKNLAQV